MVRTKILTLHVLHSQREKLFALTNTIIITNQQIHYKLHWSLRQSFWFSMINGSCLGLDTSTSDTCGERKSTSELRAIISAYPGASLYRRWSTMESGQGYLPTMRHRTYTHIGTMAVHGGGWRFLQFGRRSLAGNTNFGKPEISRLCNAIQRSNKNSVRRVILFV